MASSASSFSRRDEFVSPRCRCGAVATIKNSMTLNNPRRRFFGCPYYGRDGACGFFRWVEPPLPDHEQQVISGLLRRVKKAEVERDNARRRANALLLVLVLIVCGICLAFIVSYGN